MRMFDDPRIHIVVIEQFPNQNDGQVICVYLSKCEGKRESIIDHTTILNPGDHLEIITRSFVRYQNTRCYGKTQLKNNVDTKDYHDPVKPEILSRIRQIFRNRPNNCKISNEMITLFNNWYEDELFRSMKNF
jgi:hypothetical protein